MRPRIHALRLLGIVLLCASTLACERTEPVKQVGKQEAAPAQSPGPVSHTTQPSSTQQEPAAASPSAAGGLLDLNSATREQLRELPGIGEVYSAKIIQHRPYKRKDELVHQDIIPQATYDKIKEQIIAKQ